ncbi:hypothetical protein KIPB_008387, partial [Kipferlia bialata]
PLTPEGSIPDCYHPTEPYSAMVLGPGEVFSGTPCCHMVEVDVVGRSATHRRLDCPWIEGMGRYAVARVGDYVCVFGGCEVDTEPVDTLRLFHLPSETWTVQHRQEGEEWPQARVDACAVCVDGSLTVLGGSDRDPMHDMWVYNMAMNKWRLVREESEEGSDGERDSEGETTPLEMPCESAQGGVVVGDTFHVASKDRESGRDLHYTYTHDSGWESRALPDFTYLPINSEWEAVSLNGDLYVTSLNGGDWDRLHTMDVETGDWRVNGCDHELDFEFTGACAIAPDTVFGGYHYGVPKVYFGVDCKEVIPVTL